MQFSKAVKKQTLAEQVAATVREVIVSGELAAGATMPTEPELCAQFGVSRAVIRDATRILMAQGLVDVRQGAGAFVTSPNNPAFADALLLALRRMEATAWDAEQFEQLLFPAAVELAATAATDADVAAVRHALDAYLAILADVARAEDGSALGGAADDAQGLVALHEGYSAFLESVLGATHNRVLLLLARPLAQLHGLRQWEGKAMPQDEMVATERALLEPLVAAIAAHDPAAARAAIHTVQNLPAAAVAAMQTTPIGETTVIP